MIHANMSHDKGWTGRDAMENYYTRTPKKQDFSCKNGKLVKKIKTSEKTRRLACIIKAFLLIVRHRDLRII